MFVTLINFLGSAFSVITGILTIILIAVYFSPKARATPFGKFFRDRALVVVFIVSFLSLIGSLVYSDVIGYAVCQLCWYQRIFMYPLVLLSGIAILRKDYWMKFYCLIFSIIGVAISLFQYLGQLGLAPLPCNAIGYGASCSERFVFELGYITIPMMAFSAFILMAVVLALSLKKDKCPIV